jgi:hypothetical protein
MPLTVPAHQVMVLPLVRGGRWPLPGAALLLGTALPDLAFCVGGYRLNAVSHLWWGPLFMSATIGLLLYAWLEGLLLPALSSALPTHGAMPFARLCNTRHGLPGSARGWGWAFAALVIGSYTHLFFDGWTHANMWPARILYPDTQLDLGRFGAVGFAHSLQSAFSAVASVIVLVWVHRALRLAPLLDTAPQGRRGLGALVAGALFGALAGLAFGLVVYGMPNGTRELVLLLMSPVPVGAFAGVTAAAWQLLAGSGDDGELA